MKEQLLIKSKQAKEQVGNWENSQLAKERVGKEQVDEGQLLTKEQVGKRASL